MKHIKKGKHVKCKLNIPKDFQWKLLRNFIKDLDDGFVGMDTHAALRARDPIRLLDSLSQFAPRCMCKADDLTSFDFYKRYQIGSLLKKYPFEGSDTLSPAIKKFEKAESLCRSFNSENYRSLEKLNECHPDFLGIIQEIRADIASVIGESPCMSSIFGHAKHGPGVSLGDSYRGGKSTTYYKFSNLPYTVTRGTLDHAKSIISTDPRWMGALDDAFRNKMKIPIGKPIDINLFWNFVLIEVDGNRLTSVPKSAETDRFIAIEPLMNVFIQLGVDRVIRSSLRKTWGYDLDSQVRNQRLAKQGSIDDDLVTVDLKMASETISLKICEMYLPAEWLSLMYDLRSPSGSHKDTSYTYEKISSMGNGFTFAIESLIFSALVRCAVRRTKSAKITAVFGDDIIIPKTAYRYFSDLLGLSGFYQNNDKTFVDGPFRESCGCDYYSGINVRPFFLKKKILNIQDIFYLYNSLIVLEERLPWYWEVEFSAAKKFLLSFIPAKIKAQFYGPITESLDTHLFSDRAIKRVHTNLRKYWKIVPRAIVFEPVNLRSSRGYKQFFFRKLMATLGRSSPNNKWDLEESDNGNAFVVTRRRAVRYSCTVGKVFN